METPDFIAQEIAAELIGNGWECRPDTTQLDPMPLFLVAPEHSAAPVIPKDNQVYPEVMVDRLNKLNPEAARLDDSQCRRVAVTLGLILEDHYRQALDASVANAVGRPDSEVI